MTVKSIKKGGTTAIFMALTLTALFGCAPTVTHAVPTDKPVATQTIEPTSAPSAVSTNTPSPTATNTPTPSPTIIPELSDEEESQLIGYNPLLNEFMAAAISGIYYEGEEIDVNGNSNVVQRIAFVYLRDIPQTKDFGIHILFNDIMIFKVTNHPDGYYTSDIPSMKLSPINETLKNIKVIETFDIHELKTFCEKRGIQFEENEMFDKITKYIEKYGLQRYIEEPYMMSTKDFLQMYLALPKEYRVPLSETITPDNALPEETIVPSSYRPYTSKDGASSINYPFKRLSNETVIDHNVPYGYRNPGYYSTTHMVTEVNHPNKPKIKI